MWNVTEVFTTPEEQKKDLPKYYASELLNITENSVPLLEIFAKNTKEMTKEENETFIKWGLNAISLLNYDDICDQQGIKFLAKSFNLPQTEISEDTKKFIRSVKADGHNLLNKQVVRYAEAVKV